MLRPTSVAWLVAVTGTSLFGCGALFGVDFSEAEAPAADAGPFGAQVGDAGGGAGEPRAGEPREGAAPGCSEDAAAACVGKCGVLRGSTCGALVTCGDCTAGQRCGGGGPNVCGVAACTAQCAGKACGASDGCSAFCTQGSCSQGSRCVAGSCRCDATSCPQGCCDGDRCREGSAPSACGTGGPQCRVCAGAETCTGHSCASSAAGAILLFGGSDRNGAVLSDTWQWDGRAWTQRSPVTSPPARTQAQMAALGGKLVLFGGRDAAGTYLADTWEWDGQTWARRSPSASPPARALGAMATLGNRAVLFGGLRGGVYLADTWEWDGQTWTERTPSGSPAARAWNPALAPSSGRLVLFGGFGQASGGTNPVSFGDTWEWDGAVWTRRAPATSPSARDSAAASALAGKMVLFGGDGTAHLDDTWEWDGQTWIARPVATSPSARLRSVMAPLGGTLVLFGGTGSGGALGDTWEWDGRAWTQLAPAASPSARDGAVAAPSP